jgi:alpha-N-acetylglucosaminidase
MEGLDYNPVVFDLMTDLIWRTEMPALDAWAADYVHRRYGDAPPKMAEAWKLLLETAYSGQPGPNNVVSLRPNLAGQRTPKKKRVNREFYDNGKLIEAGRLFLSCSDKLGGRDTYRFDLVNVTRQILANLAQEDFTDIVEAYEAKDRAALAAAGERFLGRLRDMDALLGTRREFLLGAWLSDAKRWANSDAERKLYEWNARNQITLWGPPNSWLHDYACKQWSGLLASFHAKRWAAFIRKLDEALAANRALDAEAFDKEMQAFEDAWTRGTEEYPSRPSGDAVEIARQILAKP